MVLRWVESGDFFLVIFGVSFLYDLIGEQRYTTTRVALLLSPSY